MRSPLTLKITGWFQVGWPADIGVGDVVPMRARAGFGMATSEAAGLRRLRRWATQFYPAAG